MAGCLDDDVTESNNNDYCLTIGESDKLKLIWIEYGFISNKDYFLNNKHNKLYEFTERMENNVNNKIKTKFIANKI